jgi:methylenetetrahydrofolate dehydrogenase (NADP+)/methenyltetrahydrofolate cyclohydrolase
MTTVKIKIENFCEGTVINGRKLSKLLRQQVKTEVAHLTEKYGSPPKLATVLVGEDPGSQMYVRMKTRACKRAGIDSEQHNIPDTISQDNLCSLINQLNSDNTIHGILVQLPLPDHIAEQAVIRVIDPSKDVDGLSPANIYRLYYHGDETLSAATPQGIVTILDLLGLNLTGKSAVIVNRSTIVGKPLIFLLLNRHATVTVCHSRTKDLPSVTKQADVLVSAIGRRQSDDDPYYITRDMVKEGATVIDVATPHGDCDFEELKSKVSYITPVPGGIGPMTITTLLRNVVSAYSAIMT